MITPSQIFSKAPEVFKFACTATGRLVTNGGDFSSACDVATNAIKRNPYSAPISIGGCLMLLSYLGSRTFFNHTPAVKSLDTAKKEVNILLNRVEKLLEINDSRIEIYTTIKGLRTELSTQESGASTRKDQVRERLETMERSYRKICKKLGTEIHQSLASLQLKMNSEKETNGIAHLRGLETEGLKEHIRLGPKNNLMPSDYISEKVELVERTLKKLDTEFQTELNKIYHRPKEDNPSNNDLFPERGIYQNLHQGLFEICKGLNSLLGKERTVWQKIYDRPIRVLACASGGLAGAYLTGASYFISRNGLAGPLSHSV
jgi:hypothetical protein